MRMRHILQPRLLMSMTRGTKWPLYKGHFCITIARGTKWPLYKGCLHIGAKHV